MWSILDRSPDPGWAVVWWGGLQAVVYAGLVVLMRVVRPSDVRLMMGNLLKTNR